MTLTNIIQPPARIATADVLSGFGVASEAGLIGGAKEQTNGAGDKRRFLVKLTDGSTVALSPSQAWSFLLGMTIALGNVDGIVPGRVT